MFLLSFLNLEGGAHKNFHIMQLDYDGKTVALPFNLAILRWASDTRRVFSNAKLPEGVRFYNIYGKSFDTPYDVWYVIEALNELKYCL